jgi:hypothetical protein
MSGFLRTLLVLILAAVGLVWAAVASAQTGPTGPPVGTAVPPPGNPGGKLGPTLFAPGEYPFDFHFHQQIYGYGFQAGEQVTMTIDGVATPAMTATADGNGDFSATADFTWVFCGPGATSQAAPTIHAHGDAGSDAVFAFAAPPCPELVSQGDFGGPVPDGGTGKSDGGVVSSGTAVASTAVAIGTVQPVPVGTPIISPAPVVLPTPTPHLVTFNIQGFGFAAGEHVSIRETNIAQASQLAAVATSADASGRFEITMQAYVPFPCGPGSASGPELVATGDKGTSLVSRLNWINPLLMVACPVHVGPGDPGTPPPDNPPVPAANSGTGAQTPSTLLALRLRPATARAGRMEHAVVRTAGTGVATLIVRYPSHGATHRSIHVPTSGAAGIQWRVPRSVHSGTAAIRLTFEPGHLSLQGSLTVRR